MPRVRYVNDDNPPPPVSHQRAGKFYRYCDNCNLALSRQLDLQQGKVVCPRCGHVDTNPR